MGEILSRRHGVRGARLQSHYFHARERRKSLLDPAFELFRTHSFPQDTADIATGAVFPDRNLPVTVAMNLRRTGGGSQGILFEIGGVDRGMAAGIIGSSIKFAAGADSLDNDGVDVEVSSALLGAGVLYRLVFAVKPGSGFINFWINGQIAGAGGSVAGDLGTGWANTNNGAVGQLGGLSITDRLGGLFAATLAEAEVVGPVNFYIGQLPRQFRDLSIGTTTGQGSWSNGFSAGFGG